MKPTPNQTAKALPGKALSDLVPDAIDVLENYLHDGSESTRLKAAENVLDRAGLPRTNKTINEGSNQLDISADVLTGLVAGLAQVFGVSSSSISNVKNVTPPKSKLVQSKPNVPVKEESLSKSVYIGLESSSTGVSPEIISQYMEDE